MVFAHDTEVALAAAAALVNTDGDEEGLPDIATLDQFVRTWGWTGEVRHDEAELRAVRALRPRLRRIWELDEDDVVELVNALLREGAAPTGQARPMELPPARDATRRAARHQDGRRGRDGARRRRSGR